MEINAEDFYQVFKPDSFKKYPNGLNSRVVYMFKNKLMLVASPRQNMIYTWVYSKYLRDYDQIILVDLLPKKFEFLFLGYISDDDVQFNATVICTAQIRQRSDYYEMLISDAQATIQKIKSALGRRIGFYIKNRDFKVIKSFNEEEFNELKDIIFEMNDDDIPYKLIDIEDIQISLTNENLKQNLENYRVKLEAARSDLDELHARKLIGVEQVEQSILLQEKENEISKLKFEMQRMKIEGTNQLEIKKQEQLEKIVTQRIENEQELLFNRKKKELELIEKNPNAFQTLYPEIYAELKKIELGQINKDALHKTIMSIVNLFKK